MTTNTLMPLVIVAALAALLGWWLRALVDGPRQAADRAVLEERLARSEGELAAERAASAAARAAPEQVAQAVAPMNLALERLEAAVGRAEGDRAAGSAQLAEQLRSVAESTAASHEALRRETTRLVGALGRSEVRGQWGEVQLRRLLESSGLIRGIHFTEQVSTETDAGRLRPDVVLELGGERTVVVDAKVSLRAILSVQAGDPPDEIAAARAAHTREVRSHVDRLAGKDYSRQFAAAPEFVIMFLPAESLLSEALVVDPALLEYAFERDVVVATPTTLMALLRTISHGWRQEAIAANIHQVQALGRELAERLTTMLGHLDRLGASLGQGVAAYNRTVASLESRVLVTARRFTELQGMPEVAGPRQVDTGLRSLSIDRGSGDPPLVATIGP